MMTPQQQAPGLAQTDNPPAGREEVTRTALEVAVELFAHRGPNQVSVRDIAAGSGVSHALIHRYLGSKDDILLAAIELCREQAAQYLMTIEEDHGSAGSMRVFDADQPPGRYLRIIMLATLDGYDIPASAQRLPRANVMAERVAEFGASANRDDRPFDPRVLLAGVTALVGGMSLAGDFCLAQAGLDRDDRNAVQAELDRLVGRIFGLAG